MTKPVKVTLNEVAPAAEVPATDVSDLTIIDATGRKLTIKEPDILAPYRLVEMLGNSAENRVYMQMVFPFIYLVAIDGDENILLNNKRELEALIQRLGHEGVKALRDGVEKAFGAKPKDEPEQHAAIKK